MGFYGEKADQKAVGEWGRSVTKWLNDGIWDHVFSLKDSFFHVEVEMLMIALELEADTFPSSPYSWKTEKGVVGLAH